MLNITHFNNFQAEWVETYAETIPSFYPENHLKLHSKVYKKK